MDQNDDPLLPIDVRAFPTKVAKALRYLANEAGVKHRCIDGSHVLLYPPDDNARPFKVSAHRPAERSLKYIRNFIDEWHLPTRGMKL